MKLLRGMWIGALFWVLIFFEVSILMFGFGLQGGLTYYVIHYIILAILSIFASLLYFRNAQNIRISENPKVVNVKKQLFGFRKARAGFLEGIILGIVMVLVGIILDAIITIPLFIKNYTFFLDAYLWIGFLEAIIVCGIVGSLKK